MKQIAFLFSVLFLSTVLFTACDGKEEVLPETDAVMVRFSNNSGKDIEGLVVSRNEIGSLKKGKTTQEYFRYETLGQQFGYALVEAVGEINGTWYYTASACQGVCDTPSAPHGVWLDPGYYTISVTIAKDEGNYLSFRVQP